MRRRRRPGFARPRCTWRPPASGRSASWISMPSTPPTCSARCSIGRRRRPAEAGSGGGATARAESARRVEPHPVTLDASNALQLVSGYDVVLDGTDNFTARYLVNDACVMARQAERLRKHLRGSRGRRRCSRPRTDPATGACIPNRRPRARAELRRSGRAGRAAGDHRHDPGDRGDQAAARASASRSIGRFIIYDALRMRFRELKLRRDPECAVCGDIQRSAS